MTVRDDPAARTPTEIRTALFDESVRLTDAQLLVLVLSIGASRHGKGRTRKTWTALELANDLLAAAGGRLEHLIASARRADFDRGHFGLGETLGSRLQAAMELAHRWRRGFERGGDLSVRSEGVDLIQSVLERDGGLT